MGGDHRPAANVVQLIEDGPAQGSALGRVGAGTELIEQHQGLAVGQPQNRRDPRHVRAEGAQRLFQALLVADVDQDLVEDRYLASFPRGNVHARLSHQTQ